MNRARWIVPVLAIVACTCESGPSPRPQAPVAMQPAATHDLRESMWAHFEAAAELQRAVAQGRLIDARELGGWLATKAQPKTAELVAVARAVQAAPDLPTVAALSGKLAGACASCHVERGATPSFAFGIAPPDAPGLEAQMHRHQWAAARLWEGVIGPSDEAWLAGARVMLTATIDLSATTNAKPNADVAGYAETLRAQATRAIDLYDRTARSELYSEMLHNCTSCHAIVRPNTVASEK